MGENVNEGHRQRVYKKYDKSGFKHFQEHEVLEMLLFYAIPRSNTNPLAHRLINEFGSLREVLKASPEELMKVKGVGPAVVRYFKVWREIFNTPDWSEPPEKLTEETADEYLRKLFQGEMREVFYIICLDPKDNVLCREKLSEGSFESANIDPAKAVHIALKHDSAKVVFAHNHPSGICEASDPDIQVTELLEGILFPFGIKVRDHLIYTETRTVSIMKEYKLRKDRSLKNRGKRR